ncbi:serine-threonine kinase receptor-associated protein [Echinops telfairi]|uniref:Serine-threonine kinase receptor-associated protein n=1 Tax=Echinops telfairi TaxID=9371 RepID=A0ABM0J377_ECHTE|nr:serine-threonine kinase receptor-associated protein [Echinops telfairi]
MPSVLAESERAPRGPERTPLSGPCGQPSCRVSGRPRRPGDALVLLEDHGKGPWRDSGLGAGLLTERVSSWKRPTAPCSTPVETDCLGNPQGYKRREKYVDLWNNYHQEIRTRNGASPLASGSLHCEPPRPRGRLMPKTHWAADDESNKKVPSEPTENCYPRASALNLTFWLLNGEGINVHLLKPSTFDGKPMLRQGDTGDWIGTFLGHKGAVWGATLNKDATKAATAAADFTAKVWDAVSGDELMTLAHKHIVKSVDFTQDSNYLLTGGQDKLLRIYDLNKPEAEPKEISGHTSGIKKALWCSEDKQILSADDKTVRLWDHATMTEVKSLNFNMSVSSMEYIPEGELLVITYGRTIAFHSAVSLDPIKSFEAPATINSASLHPEKEFVVAGGEDFKLYKYDYNSGEELESYKGHFGPIHCVRFSPDGELYASGSEDGTLRLWQTVVGKTYGLWKCVLPEEDSGELAKPKISFPETTEEELEEITSENSDSIYSSTPEVKA